MEKNQAPYHATNPTNQRTILKNRILSTIFMDRKEIYRGGSLPLKAALRKRTSLGKGGAA